MIPVEDASVVFRTVVVRRKVCVGLLVRTDTENRLIQMTTAHDEWRASTISRRSPSCLNLRFYEKTSEERNCPDVVVDKEESAHEEDMHEEISGHAWPKGSENGKSRLSLFSHIGHSFGRDSFDSSLYSLSSLFTLLFLFFF